MPKKSRVDREIKLEFVVVREMTPAQAEFIARMFYRWYLRRKEREEREANERSLAEGNKQ
jgi:hypothetical protein